ncbi:MAG TPA: hypothetical protein VIK61_14905, partial [Acidimicrobiia bacterium]
MVAELVEHPGRDPFVASGPQRRVGNLAVQDRFDADPRTAGDKADQDPPETQSVRDAGSMTTQRMIVRRWRREQRLNRCPDGIYHFGFERAHD